ncbi:NAD(P)-dependent oxidoreductase [Herbiconiux sp. CPCC 205763]|uniref:NAD(P)-dependent oxidoreductase n=1 Tax=Herbiconiux aconitum TaxID=2970913 RepID=A0ABT2GSB8_9MICO|nr:NAD(P)-dependent oxidoreductase [Herbiconiux aconitum]MCS5719122.1 NAD(P)-dependent oxidoreductase [Herbiconiux aconitum]
MTAAEHPVSGGGVAPAGAVGDGVVVAAGGADPRDRAPDAGGDRPLRVLVSGASGFVGGALLRRLAGDLGFDALGLGRRPLDRADYRMLDLADAGAAHQLDALGFRPDVIVHAAARSSPWGTWAEFERENVGTTRSVVDYATRQATRPRLVFVSTASVLYTASDQVGVSDDVVAGPRFVNDYAASKYTAELAVRDYPGEWAVLRPRAVFGPGDTTLLPRLLSAARRGALPRFRTGRSGPVLSDLVYIDTLVEQLVVAATSPAVVGQTVVVTNGEPVPLQETVFGLLDRMGVPRPHRSISRRTALAAATALEWAWRMARRSGEPPITRYSVIVYAYSKTFDARRCRELFGPPAVSVGEGLDRVVASLVANVAASRAVS